MKEKQEEGKKYMFYVVLLIFLNPKMHYSYCEFSLHVCHVLNTMVLKMAH